MVAWGWGRVGGGEGVKRIWVRKKKSSREMDSDLENFELKCLNLRPIFWSQNRSQKCSISCLLNKSVAKLAANLRLILQLCIFALQLIGRKFKDLRLIFH